VTNQLLNDRYQIISTLGSGGFGETFLAEDIQMPSRRRCVVKRLRPTQNDPALTKLIQERFQREAAILETLSGGSKQIPQLYAYFYLASDGQFYIVQEWVDGDTLSALVAKNGRLDETAVRKILTDILPVFSYIHSRSIVHRDIKPDNIILRHSDRLPVLIDFGAVREAMGTVFNSQGQPTQSIVIGTPGYMPSEQSIGRPVYSSDLYSLGLTAIYLLTGQQPTDLPSDPSSAEILWRSQAPQVSSSFAQILDRAISYHHRDRYATAADFLGALTGAAATAPSHPVNIPSSNSNVATYAVAPANAAPASAPTRSTSDTKKLIIGGAIAATILGGTMGTALWMNNAKVSNNSSNSASSPSAAAVPAAPLSTATPISPSPEASPSGQPSATDNRTPISSTPAAPRPNSSKPSTANPSNPAPQASATKAAASPPATLTPPSAQYDTPSNASNTPSAANNNVDPTNTIEAYYNDINNRDYKTAWSKLPQDLQADRQVHPAGYSSFESWWNSVEAIEIRNVQLLNRTAQSSEVIAKTNYRMKNGQVRPYRLHYWLGWNEATQKWEITKIRSK
jgi:serine/threonine protein kinase, bacterial